MQVNDPSDASAPGGPEASGPEEAVIAAMMSIGRLMKVRLADGIDPGTHHLLHTLRCAGAVRVTDLAASSRLDISTVSRHVATLERNGLVARSPHPDDGRAMAVDLTLQGQDALDEAIRARKRLLVGLLADWPHDDIATFARLLTTFAAGADVMTHQLSDEPTPKSPERTSPERSTELEHA